MQQYRSMDTTTQRAEVLNAFMRGVYTWMTLGLGITAALAWIIGNALGVDFLRANPQAMYIFYGLLIGELVLVFTLSAAIHKISAATATGMFLLYSALNGVTLAPIVMVYAQAAIFKAFITTAGMFGAMSIYGLTTKKDLTSMGSFLIMGLFGLIIAMVVNLFMASAAVDFAISILGVLIFAGLTAFDTQRMRLMGEQAPRDAQTLQKGRIMGALTLYLDFINLFLFLLRLFANRE